MIIPPQGRTKKGGGDVWSVFHKFPPKVRMEFRGSRAGPRLCVCHRARFGSLPASLPSFPQPLPGRAGPSRAEPGRTQQEEEEESSLKLGGVRTHAGHQSPPRSPQSTLTLQWGQRCTVGRKRGSARNANESVIARNRKKTTLSAFVLTLFYSRKSGLTRTKKCNLRRDLTRWESPSSFPPPRATRTPLREQRQFDLGLTQIG